MEFPKRRPGEKRANKTWTRIDIEPGSEFSGWIAGACVWVETHYVGASKPCREIFTQGVLGCPLEVHRKRLEWTGYQPVYDVSGSPCCVLLKEYNLELLEKFALHEAVRFKKSKRDKAPVEISAFPGIGKFASGALARQEAVKIDEWLLLLWGDEMLTRWVQLGCPSDLRGTPLDDMAIPGLRAPGEPGDMSHAFDRLKARRNMTNDEFVKWAADQKAAASVPSTNGTHPKPKKGGTAS